MPKKLKKYFIILVFCASLLGFNNFVEAASAKLTASSNEVNVGEEVTVTANIVAGSWNLTLTGAGKSEGIVGQTSETANETKSVNITFTPQEANEYKFLLKGDITDFSTEVTEMISEEIVVKAIEKEDTNQNTDDNKIDNTNQNNNSNINNNTNNNTKKSSEARLRDLGLNPKQYDFKGFKSDIYEYNIEVPNEAEKVYIYATTKDKNAKVKSGDGNIALNEGENKIEIVVVAEDGKTKKTYTLNITRKAGEQTTTPVEEPVIDEQPQTNSTTASTAEETSSTTSSENIKTTSTTKTESTSTKSENQQIVGKVDWLKPETWGQEQYILVAVLAFLVLTIIVSIILKIKIKKSEEEEIEFPGAEELDRAMFEHQELSDNGNIDDNYYNDDMNDENPYSTNFNDDYYNDNTQHDEEKIDNQPVEVEYKEENTSDDYNDDVSEKNDEYIERKRMLEEYFAGQDGKDTKVKRTKTRGKHF